MNFGTRIAGYAALCGLAAAYAVSAGYFTMPSSPAVTAREPAAGGTGPSQSRGAKDPMNPAKTELATLGGGCFWCVEAVYVELRGVRKVVSGYSGGTTDNPTYKEICTGKTGHAEVIQVEFDPAQISYEQLLQVFLTVHDPTTLNRQGNDVGTQYRSVIFYHSPEQKASAEKIVKEVDAAKIWPNPLVTEISELKKFYPAEDYHQNYFAENPYQPYCRAVIAPKVAKFRKQFTDQLKK